MNYYKLLKLILICCAIAPPTFFFLSVQECLIQMRNEPITPPFIANNKIKANFRAGNGESFVTNIRVWNGTDWVDAKTPDNEEVVEDYFYSYIHQNNHADGSKYGYVICDKGKVIENESDI